jgi:hypothetical protein
MLIPKKEYADWLSLLLSGDNKMCGISSTDISTSEKENVMSQAALSDFMESCGEWETLQGVAIGFNKPLGEAAHLVRLTAQAPPALPRMRLTVPIRIAIIGAPFTGKSTLAKELASMYSARVLDPETLVNKAVAAAAVYTAPVPQVCAQHNSYNLVVCFHGASLLEYAVPSYYPADYIRCSCCFHAFGDAIRHRAM